MSPVETVDYVMRVTGLEFREAFRLMEHARLEGRLRTYGGPDGRYGPGRCFNHHNMMPPYYCRADVLALWPEVAAVREEPASAYHTGLPGKPTAWYLIENECRR